MKPTKQRARLRPSERHTAPPSTAFLTVLVGLFAIALYLPAIGFDFVYDSHPIVLVDTFIHQPWHFADILTLRVMGLDVMDFNRPMNLFSLMVDSVLWGKDAPGYHLTNIVLHAIAASLLFRWLFALVGQRWPALLAALLFAAHPLNCEPVAEVCNRKDLLATLFMLAGLLCAARFRPSADADREQSGRLAKAQSAFADFARSPFGFGTVAFFFLSVASKESGVAGPAILAIYWFLFRKKEKRGPWRVLLAFAVAAVGAFLFARFALEPKSSVIFVEKPTPLASDPIDFLQIQIRIWAAEILRIVWPSPGSLCADYNGNSIRNISFTPALLAISALLATQGVVFAMVNNPRNHPRTRPKRARAEDPGEVPNCFMRCVALAGAVFWFSLLPVSNLIPIYHPMADRFLYMPLIGFALMLAVLLAASDRLENLKPLAVTSGLIAISTLAALTWNEEQIWRDDLSLWKATSERNPASFNAFVGLGSAWINHCQPEKAFEPLRQAIELSKGKRAEPFGELALAAHALGRQQEAATWLARAAELDVRYHQPDLLLQALLADPWEVQRYSLIAAHSKHAK